VIPRRLVLFADGSAFSRVIDRRSARLVPRGFGAAVAYKMYGRDDIWHERLYHLRGGPSTFRTELTAVAEALAIALPWAIQKTTLDESYLEAGLGACEVVIFTDSQDVLRRREKLRDEALTEHRMLKGDPVLRKVITRSQYLRQLAVRVELHWVPGHADVEGNERADAAARLAAVESDDGITRDGGLVLIEAELARQQRQSLKLILPIETRGHQGTRRRIIAGKELQD
jgi:ribonuclease HI